jgi:hypothetical protein
MKHAYILLLLSGLSSVSAQEQPPVPATFVAPTTKDDLTIIPMEAETSDEASDIAALLNIKFWHFKVKKPAGVPLVWRLELREAGKTPIGIQDGVLSFPKELQEAELTLGIMLDEGQSIESSPMIKVYMRSRYRQNGVRTSGGYYLPTREKNPLFGLKTSSVATYFSVPAKDDGTIRLMDFETGEKEAPVKNEVVLVINREQQK